MTGIDAMYGRLFLVLLLGLTGCRKDVSQEAVESDANGYLCRKCQHRFFVTSKIFAERCPSCKGMELSPVVGFVCARDQELTLVARGPNSIACPKCAGSVTATRLPGAEDFKKWGARPASSSEVLLKP